MGRITGNSNEQLLYPLAEANGNSFSIFHCRPIHGADNKLSTIRRLKPTAMIPFISFAQ